MLESAGCVVAADLLVETLSYESERLESAKHLSRLGTHTIVTRQTWRAVTADTAEPFDANAIADFDTTVFGTWA